ncbi:hypothetical protein A1O1_01979 [Capronia coronata CBS 617.96]|uniref:Membrane insertase YidC/Oxa/ALB C-terminal domain-containing protein n=1 Tax=Capronia coronata CBS 617.96 TaxID=1182541 RepID=W9YKZ6_9EURO|nr:uncharacterized protein A1O1_01979 [Capronia coronata CBS 617.96]EXJ93587.1 hypothetical protein A1O1_01979 [Capronia coronata CBS 617.96]
MSLSQGLRWSGRGIGNVRQRLVIGSREVRHFSLHTSRVARPTTRVTRSPAAAGLKSSHQTRSLSLFGWGSKQNPEQAAAAQPSLTETAAPASGSSQNVVETARTFKASHATSETPDLTFTHPHPVSAAEPEALRDLENAILKPHGATPPIDTVDATPDLASIPEGLGYLKHVCGLDFGWGPTAMLEVLLEHLHITAGLSWSASVVGLAFLVRLITLPAFIAGSDQSARLREVQGVVSPLRAELQEALRTNNRQVAMEKQHALRAINKEYGISLPKAFGGLMLQIPLGFGAFRLLRNAGTLPVPGFESEHFLWLTNLSLSDPTYILPLMIGVMTYYNFKISQRASVNNMGNIVRILTPLLPIGSFVCLAFQPAALQLYFLVNSIFTQFQSMLLYNSAFRKWADLRPLPPRGQPNSPTSTSFSKMNVAQKPAVVVQPTPAKPVKPVTDRSVIDKGVDLVKEKGQQAWKSTLGNMSDTWQKEKLKRIEKEKQEKRAAAVAKYEAQRRQDLEEQRYQRNAGAVGPMRIDKNSEAPLASRREDAN